MTTPDPGWLRAGVHGRVLRAARERLLAPSHRVFVDAAFRALLWRRPDEAGMRHYAGGISRGEFSRLQALRDIGQSAEAAERMLAGPGIRLHVDTFTAAGRRVPDGVAPVCFLHAMKCGGTTLAYGLSVLAEPWPRLLDVWVDQLLCLPPPMVAQARLVTGHLPFDALGLLPPGTVSCTVVREPVSRTLSHLAHVRTHGGHPRLTVEEFVGDRRWRAVWADYQARQLAADLPVDDARAGRHPGPLQDVLDAPIAVDAGELARRAVARLAAVDIVGVTDDLDAVVRQVARRWGKPPPAPLVRTNQSPASATPERIPASLLADIAAGTEADAALYEAATERSRLPGSRS